MLFSRTGWPEVTGSLSGFAVTPTKVLGVSEVSLVDSIP